MSDDLRTRLIAQRDWEKAVRKAERTGDLTEIAALLRSGAPVGFATHWLAMLFNDHRLVRKKRGNWKSIFEPTARQRYALAAGLVRNYRTTMTNHRRVSLAWRPRPALAFLLNDDERLEDINDPVAFVARKKGLKAEKLQNAVLGKTGFGRGRKPKPGGSAPK
jgi:hypothetical protein